MTSLCIILQESIANSAQPDIPLAVLECLGWNETLRLIQFFQSLGLTLNFLVSNVLPFISKIGSEKAEISKLLFLRRIKPGIKVKAEGNSCFLLTFFSLAEMEYILTLAVDTQMLSNLSCAKFIGAKMG